MRWWLPNGCFIILSSLLYSSVDILLQGKSSFLLFLIYLFTWVWIHDSCFIQLVKICYYNYYFFNTQIIPGLLWEPFQAGFHFLTTYLHHSLSPSLFLAQNIPSLHSLCPCIKISHFSKKLGFLSVKNNFLETKIRVCVCSLHLGYHCPRSLLERTRRCIHMCVHTHTHTHTHICTIMLSFCLHTCVSTYLCKIITSSHRYLQF